MLEEMFSSLAIYGLKDVIRKNKQKHVDNLFDIHKQNYDAQMTNARTLFDKSYYSSYLDNPTARNMLKRVQEQMNNKSKSLRNTAAVMGYTPESLAIAQKENNRALDSMIGNLAQADVAAKERAVYAYDKRRNTLDDYLYKAKMSKLESEYELKKEYLNDKVTLTKDFVEPLIMQLNSKLMDSLKSALSSVSNRENENKENFGPISELPFMIGWNK